MNVYYNNEYFSVRFNYSARETRTKELLGKAALTNVHNRQIKTYCDICVKDGEGRYYTIASGVSIKNKIDKFDKGLGRRMALQQALSQIASREIRSVIWDAYMTEHKDGLTTKEVLE